MSKLLRYRNGETYVHEKCGYKFIVWRSKGGMRKIDHLKRLYCPQCDITENFKKQDDA